MTSPATLLGALTPTTAVDTARSVETLGIVGILALLLILGGLAWVREWLVPGRRLTSEQAKHETELATERADFQRVLGERNEAWAEIRSLRDGYEKETLPALLEATRTLGEALSVLRRRQPGE